MKKRAIKLLSIYLIILAILAIYSIFCHFTGFGIPCIIHLITGLKCPACGLSRFCLGILSLNLSEAIRYNYMAPLILLIILVIIVRLSYHYIKTGKKEIGLKPEFLNWVLIAFFLAWGIVRNIIAA